MNYKKKYIKYKKKYINLRKDLAGGQTIYRFNNKEELQHAVNQWCLDSEAAKKKYGEIIYWDVSQITDMSGLFRDKANFNAKIMKWNVSNVTNMSHMFHGASEFNNPLKWDVSNVTDMSYMFSGAKKFNSLLFKWDVSKVTNMSHMFEGAISFNRHNIRYWNVSSVMDMSYMFSGASNFNQPINSRVLYLSNPDKKYIAWDVSSVTNMSHMFSGANKFNQEINRWNISSVTNMSHMFFNASEFNRSLESWDLLSAVLTDNMFTGAANFNYNEPQNLLNKTLTELETKSRNNNLDLLYLSSHGSSTGNLFIVPENTWLVFSTRNKTTSPFNWEDSCVNVSGANNDEQEILELMNQGNYRSLKKIPYFTNNMVIYPPGGVVEDLNFNVIIHNENRLKEGKMRNFLYTGIMEPSAFTKKLTLEESDIRDRHFNELSEVKKKREFLLRYNQPNDEYFKKKIFISGSTKSTLKRILDYKNRNKNLVLFISACRVNSNFNQVISSDFDVCRNINGSKLFSMPIPKDIDDNHQNLSLSLSLLEERQLKQPTMGIGNNNIRRNYYWLKNNKEYILETLNAEFSKMYFIRNFNEHYKKIYTGDVNMIKVYLKELHNNQLLSVRGYCDFLELISKYF